MQSDGPTITSPSTASLAMAESASSTSKEYTSMQKVKLPCRFCGSEEGDECPYCDESHRADTREWIVEQRNKDMEAEKYIPTPYIF